jgi:DNA mismatch repair protein MutS2
VVSTHISDLKKMGYEVPGIENASIEFDVETLRPTHRLLIGTPGSSNALAIARRLGLPEEVVARAERAPGKAEGTELINQLQASRAAAREDRERAAGAREAAERLEQERRRQVEKLAKRLAEPLGGKAESALTALRAVRRQVEGLVAREPTRRALLQGLREIGAVLEEQLQQLSREERGAGLRVGDEVLVRSLDRVGVLREIDAQEGKAVVAFGAVPMRVGLEDVEAA